MTFSLAGRDPHTGDIGYAVATSSVCVGGRVGALTEGCVVFSQCRTDPRLHRPGVRRWEDTQDASAAMQAMQEAATALHWRQLGVLPASGEGLHFTGASCLGVAGGLTGANSLALGNFLGSEDVLSAMINGFETTGGSLAERLITGMLAGQAAGGERDPLQSAAIAVLGEVGLKDVDLRIDESSTPLEDLDRMVQDWLPKAAAYRLRALDPDAAPSSSSIEHG